MHRIGFVTWDKVSISKLSVDQIEGKNKNETLLRRQILHGEKYLAS